MITKEQIRAFAESMNEPTAGVHYMMTEADIEGIANNFSYHAPFGNQTDRYEAIRAAAAAPAALFLRLCPPSAERTLAYRKLQEAVFWANASIALNETPPVEVEDTNAI